MLNNALFRIGAFSAAITGALLVNACTTPQHSSLKTPGGTARPLEVQPKPRAGVQTVSYVPISVKAAATPGVLSVQSTRTKTAARRAPKRTATVQAVPSGQDYTFDLGLDSWPAGVSTLTVKVRCFAATIYDNGGVAAIDWDSSSPLAVFPGSSATYKNVTLSQGSSPQGTVTVNMPTSMAGQNFILHIAKYYSGTDTNFGGGAIFSTQ